MASIGDDDDRDLAGVCIRLVRDSQATRNANCHDAL